MPTCEESRRQVSEHDDGAFISTEHVRKGDVLCVFSARKEVWQRIVVREIIEEGDTVEFAFANEETPSGTLSTFKVDKAANVWCVELAN